MVDEQVNEFLRRIEEAFADLLAFLHKRHGQKSTSDIKKLKNLFKGLIAWSKHPDQEPYLHPARILDFRARRTKATVAKRNLNAIAQSVLRLRQSIHEAPDSYYRTRDGTISGVTFSIESYHREGRYRLKIELDGHDFVDIVRGIKKTEVSVQRYHASREEHAMFWQQYMLNVKDDFSYLNTKHLGGTIPLPENNVLLEDIYIPLRAARSTSLSKATHLTETTKWLSGISSSQAKDKAIVEKESFPPENVEKILHDILNNKSESRWLVILGEPGAGKSTLLAYLAYSLASGKAEQWGFKRFTPFFVDLFEYARSNNQDLMQYCVSKSLQGLADEKQKEGIREALSEVLNKCAKERKSDDGVFFLLDGLNNAKEKQCQVAQQIEVLRNRYKNAFIIVSSRSLDYYETPLNAFDHFVLDNLQYGDIIKFINTWFDVLSRRRKLTQTGTDWSEWKAQRCRHLLNHIDRNPSLKRISTNPLYLSFLVLISSDPDTHLPETQVRILDQYFAKLILDREREYRSSLGYKSILQAFVEISVVIHRSFFGDLQEDTTKDFVCNYIADQVDSDPEKLLEFWVNAGVFFVAKTLDQNELILPRYQTFVEYGLACKLSSTWDASSKRASLWKSLTSNLHNSSLFQPLALFFCSHSLSFFFCRECFKARGGCVF